MGEGGEGKEKEEKGEERREGKEKGEERRGKGR